MATIKSGLSIKDYRSALEFCDSELKKKYPDRFWLGVCTKYFAKECNRLSEVYQVQAIKCAEHAYICNKGE